MKCKFRFISQFKFVNGCNVSHARLIWFETTTDAHLRPKKFSVCWGEPEEAVDERKYIIQNMKHVKLESKTNPLAKQIRKLLKYFAKDADKLREKNEFVSVIICTHGIPTDEQGKSGKSVLKEFQESVQELCHMPVRILFRLTTDNEKVLDFYATLDAIHELDVLDDFWGEVRISDNHVMLFYFYVWPTIAYFLSVSRRQLR